MGSGSQKAIGSSGWIGGTKLAYNAGNRNISIADVPEPATRILLGLGLLGMGFNRKLKHSL